MEAKGPTCFHEEKQPHHSHMSDKQYPRVVKYLVQDEVTGVDL